MPLVLIGTCDEPISKKFDIDWATNKIGGNPEWMSHKIPQFLCKNCQSRLLLVMQLYCPLEGSPYHRTLYLFACIKRKCFNNKQSWLVLRCQRLDTVIEESCHFTYHTTDSQTQFPLVPPSGFETPLVMDTWCQDQDSWGELDPDVKVSTPNFACRTTDYVDELNQLDNLSLSETQQSPVDVHPLDIPESDSSSEGCNDFVDDSPLENKMQSDFPLESDPSLSEQTKCFNSFYINAFEETMLSMESNSSHVQDLLQCYNATAQIECKTNDFGISKETYEKDNASHGDTVFYKFFKRISICPEQIVRYSRNGVPLYLRQPSSDLMQIPSCQYCDSPCIYELQIMPALVNYLRLPNIEGIPLEFGTVFVYTCKSSCWKEGDTFKEEYIYVQPDPDADLLP